MTNSVKILAHQLEELRRRLEADGNSPQLGHSSIESGRIAEFAGDTLVQVVGTQYDGTHTTAQFNGTIPPTPTNPTVADGTEAFTVTWDGTFVLALVAPMDFLRVDIHAGGSAGFTPTPATRVGEFTAALGGTASIVMPVGTYYIKLVVVSQSGVMSAPSDAVEVDSWPIVASTDGFAPASSPAAEVIGGLDVLHVRYPAIVNADPVTYKIHIGTAPGFTPDSTTLVGKTESTAFTIKALPGSPPALPTDPDPRKLDYALTYYVKVVASDADGDAAAGAEASASIYQVTGENLAADSVTAAQVVAGTLTGDLFSASVVISGAFRTAEAGQRVEMTPLGFFAYKPDGSIMLKIPTDSPDAFFDGELIVRGATILGGMSIRSSQNEITADAALTLMRGIVPPTTTPQFQITWDTVTPSTASLSAAQRTTTDPTWTLGAPFHLVASEVVYTRWVAAETMWIFFQQRSNGTRVWYFNPDGTPKDRYGTGVYCTDVKDWHIWSEIELTTSPGKNGTYTMFRFLPNDTYYVNTPVGIKRYSRQNGVAAPVVGHNGTDIFVAEVVNTNQLNIRYFVPTAPLTDMPTPFSTYTSAQGYNVNTSLSNVWQSSFDIGSARYLTAERGVTNNCQLVYTSGSGAGSIHPGGTTAGAGSWASSTRNAETFEAPASRRCTAWDGTNFFTYGADGLLYKHTSERWDPSVTSSQLWGQVTLRDNDALGTGTHETTPGTVKAFVHKRRAKFIWTPPAVPDNGGTDDPDRACLYMGRIDGSTKPANSAMYKQGESTTPTLAPLTITTLTTATANPPTTNTFPASNPAIIRNDNDELQIKGDGTIKAKQIFIGSDEVLALEPYWYGSLNAAKTGATSTFTTIDNWTAEGTPNSSGITIASGIFTVPRSGRYNVKAQLYWGLIASPTGNRVLQAVYGSGPVTLVSHTCWPSATLDSVNQIDKDVRLTAGQTLSIRFRQTQGTTIGPSFATLDLSWVQIKYVGP